VRFAVLGSMWLTREIEIALALAVHLECDDKELTATWLLPVSKTDPGAASTRRQWRCTCKASIPEAICPYHCADTQLQYLRFRHGDAQGKLPPLLPLFPDAHGQPITKQAAIDTIEALARALNRPLVDSLGRRAFGGHSLRVSGAQYLAAVGVPVHLIQLLGRWASDTVLQYVREAPLLHLSATYMQAHAMASRISTADDDADGELDPAAVRDGARHGCVNVEMITEHEGYLHDDTWVKNARAQVLHRRSREQPHKARCGWIYADLGRPVTARETQLGAQKCRHCFAHTEAEQAQLSDVDTTSSQTT